ncbi:hypothetical protein OGATHE_006638 [Ogataea polymorpha]|uniref:Uncharacterized protein n=1 Tax=Ogataea polymorpha TaxID=460523 RepID=A0A9P8NT53_9ASCO|nr:hypothetical protein OGATHE_006638 [Ogataea polymorpha]
MKTFFLAFIPSISVSSWLTTLSDAPPASPMLPPLALAIESSSSRKTTVGAAALALSKMSLMLDSDSPYHILSNSGPLTEMKLAETSVATAFAKRVLPVPGGPKNKTPFEGERPNLVYWSGCRTGYSTVSFSSCLIPSKPPMSSQVTLTLSTTVSRNADGLELPRANLKLSIVTPRESRTSASMFSSSKSIKSIFSLISRASRSTSSASFMFLVWILRTSSLPAASGIPMSTSLSNLPNLLKAGSIELGLLVAAITTTFDLAFIPSIKVKSWETTLLSTSPFVLSLFGAIESISSMKMIDGEFFSASSKAFLRLLSDSPAIFDMISGPLIRKKNAPVSLATALAIKVLPVPGGPYIKIPLGGLIPMALNNCGCLSGNSTSSLIWAICFLQPPMSSHNGVFFRLDFHNLELNLPHASSDNEMITFTNRSVSINKVWLQEDIEQRSGDTFNGVCNRQHRDSGGKLDFGTWVNCHNVPKTNSQVVPCHSVDSTNTILDIIIGQNDQDSVLSLLSFDQGSITTEQLQKLHRVGRHRNDGVVIIGGIVDN